TLTSMREQMALGLDPFGHTPHELPMTGLPDRLMVFQKSLDTVFGTGKKGGTLQFWDDARLAALAAGQATDAARQVDQLDRMLRAESADRAAIAQRISTNTDQLLKMVQGGAAKIAEAVELDATLSAQHQDEKAQALTFGRIVDDLIVNETTI